LIEIINKPLLLHLVGYLYYWQMGFNSVFKELSMFKIISHSVLLSIRNVQTKVVQIIKTDIVNSKTLSCFYTVYHIMWKNIVQPNRL